MKIHSSRISRKDVPMDFEDSKLPDHPQLREAFKKAVFDSSLAQRSNPHLTDDGFSPGSLSLLTRAGEVLAESLTAADPDVVACAVLFLTSGFGQPELIRRSVGGTLPKTAALCQEWRDVQTRKILLNDASPDLRQVIMAVNTALLYRRCGGA
jgi:hypothetical protein